MSTNPDLPSAAAVRELARRIDQSFPEYSDAVAALLCELEQLAVRIERGGGSSAEDLAILNGLAARIFPEAVD